MSVANGVGEFKIENTAIAKLHFESLFKTGNKDIDKLYVFINEFLYI